MTGILDHKDAGILRSMRSDSRKPMGTAGESQGASKATAGRRAAKTGEGIMHRHRSDTDRGNMGAMNPSVAVQTADAPASVVTDNPKAHKGAGFVCKSFGDPCIMFGMRTKNTDGLCEFIQTGLLNMPAARNAGADVLAGRAPFNDNPSLCVHGTRIKGKG